MSDLDERAVAQALHEAADVDPVRDYATLAWEQAANDRRRRVWRGAGLVAAAAVALAVVLGPWGPGRTEAPTPAGVVPGDAVTFVFQRDGSSADPARSPSAIRGATVPEPTDLAETRWWLVGHLGESGGTADQLASEVSVMSFSDVGSVGARLGITVADCGGPFVVDWLILDATGRFDAQVIDRGPSGQCPESVRTARHLWTVGLIDGGWLHQSGQDTLLLSVSLPPPPPPAPGGPQPIGARLTIEVPEGWVLLYRTLVGDEGRSAEVVVSCLSRWDQVATQHGGCSGLEVTAGGETALGEAEVAATVAVACGQQDPVTLMVQGGGGLAEAGGPSIATYQSWLAACLELGRFEVVAWTFEDWPLTLVGIGMDGTTDHELVAGTVRDGGPELRAMVIDPPAIGSGEVTAGGTAYEIEEETSCVLIHPGPALTPRVELAECAVLQQLAADATTGLSALMAVVTDDGRLAQLHAVLDGPALDD